MVKKLESIKVKAANGNGEVWVYDSGVDYRPAESKNYSYYNDENGKRWKTRPYAQFSCLVNRRKNPRSGDKTKVIRSELFQKFDGWMSWAVDQAGFMHEDCAGNIYQLDKDILGDSEIYHESVCVFVPPYINGGYALWGGYSKTARRDLLLRMFDEDFDVVDERVIDTFCNMAEFNYGLKCLIGMSKEDCEAKDDFLLRLSQLSAWRDVEDVNSGVLFQGDSYTLKFSLGGKNFVEKGFSCPLKAIKKKLSLKLEFIRELKSDIEKHEKFVGENFYKTVCEKLEKYRMQEYLVKSYPKRLNPRIKVYTVSYI